ncbi:MAG: sugar phosphate isomerase/epimerase [Fibromonadaceae bacterium]|nr:sugar phosphate isomerase/epimerase [Fibromonadaceae bacterium]
MQVGLKLGSPDSSYKNAIYDLWEKKVFQYIEILAVPNSYKNTIDFWKQFKIPFIIHAPHLGHGMNPSIREKEIENKEKIKETIEFANALNAEYMIFHPGALGNINETVRQYSPFVDSRFLIENKPFIALDYSHCLGSKPEEIKFLMEKLGIGFCFDFGHAVCTANSLKKEPMELIEEFLALKPQMYHLTDGIFTNEKDEHLRYGKGSFPLADFLKLIPQGAKVTNEARHDFKDSLDDFLEDVGKLFGEPLR